MTDANKFLRMEGEVSPGNQVRFYITPPGRELSLKDYINDFNDLNIVVHNYPGIKDLLLGICNLEKRDKLSEHTLNFTNLASQIAGYHLRENINSRLEGVDFKRIEETGYKLTHIPLLTPKEIEEISKFYEIPSVREEFITEIKDYDRKTKANVTVSIARNISEGLIYSLDKRFSSLLEQFYPFYWNLEPLEEKKKGKGGK